jgi:transposase
LAALVIPAGCEPAPSTGPTGFELARLLHSMGVGCQVIAPSLIPTAPGDGPKPDWRHARRLARLHPGPGSWSPSTSPPRPRRPSVTCAGPAPTWSVTAPARGIGCRSSRLRHGRAWRGGDPWTLAHERWLLGQHFDQPAMAATDAYDRAVLDTRDGRCRTDPRESYATATPARA